MATNDSFSAPFGFMCQAGPQPSPDQAHSTRHVSYSRGQSGPHQRQPIDQQAEFNRKNEAIVKGINENFDRYSADIDYLRSKTQQLEYDSAHLRRQLENQATTHSRAPSAQEVRNDLYATQTRVEELESLLQGIQAQLETTQAEVSVLKAAHAQQTTESETREVFFTEFSPDKAEPPPEKPSCHSCGCRVFFVSPLYLGKTVTCSDCRSNTGPLKHSNPRSKAAPTSAAPKPAATKAIISPVVAPRPVAAKTVPPSEAKYLEKIRIEGVQIKQARQRAELESEAELKAALALSRKEATAAAQLASDAAAKKHRSHARKTAAREAAKKAELEASKEAELEDTEADLEDAKEAELSSLEALLAANLAKEKQQELNQCATQNQKINQRSKAEARRRARATLTPYVVATHTDAQIPVSVEETAGAKAAPSRKLSMAERGKKGQAAVMALFAEEKTQ